MAGMTNARFFYLLERSFTCPKCKQRGRQFVGASMVKSDPPLIAESAKNIPIKCEHCDIPLPAGVAVIGEVREIAEDRYKSLKIPHRMHIEN